MELLNLPEGKLRIAWYASDIDCLGPGKRFAIWVQGCHKHCKDCIAERLQDTEGGQLVDIDKLARQITTANIEGISISGGEPFLQANALAHLLELVRWQRPELGVIVYTGALYEQLMQDNATAGLLSYIDLLVDGAYEAELDDGAAMRGSSNQRLLFLTGRYSADDLPTERRNKIIFQDNSFMMIGIPSAPTKVLINLFAGGDTERNGSE